MKYFCTYFDRNFLYQGLALYESLRKHAGEFTLWVLCFDEVTYDLLNLLKLPGLNTINLDDFEAAHPDLLAVKSDRTFVEYYWTATPIVLNHIFRSQPHINELAYLDADLFFYNDLQPIYDEWGSGSIYLIPHRFGPKHQKNGELEAGLYNVGFVGFKRDVNGLAAIERWTQQNIEWCYDRIEKGKLGDQKYLHDWAERFRGVVVSENIGVGSGGWNIMNYRFNMLDNTIKINGRVLIMLHLNFIELLNKSYIICLPRLNYRLFYRPYAEAIKNAIDKVNIVDDSFNPIFAQVSMPKLIYTTMRGGLVKL